MIVLYIVTGLSTGGAEQMLFNLLSVQKNEGVNPVILSLMNEGSLGKKLTDIGIPVYTLNIQANTLSAKALFKLRKIIKSINPDIIQGWMYHGNIAAMVGRALSAVKAPVIWSIHHSLDEIDKEKPLTRFLIRLGAITSKYTSKIHYCSRLSSLQHEKYGYCKSRTIIIPNGFDCSKFAPDSTLRKEVRRQLSIRDDAIVIGHIARYHPIKDHVNFLTAASKLLQTGLDTYFVLSGAGVTNANNDINSFIRNNGLEKNVILLGERDDIPILMNGFDIYTSSSWSEAFPVVLGEAMACCIPCVATDAGDSSFIVGATGKIVPARNPELLADALIDMIALGDEGRRNLGKLARQRIIENFSLQTVTERFVALYKSLLE